MILAAVHSRSEAAAAEANRITDVDPGSGDAEIGAYPFGTATIDGNVYFSLDDAEHGRELWRSDGTIAGTWLVADLNPGPQDSFPNALTAIGSTLYFGAADADGGCRLWRSDGTAAGTRPLATFQSSFSGCYDPFQSTYAGPRHFTVVGSTVFFVARDDEHGEELWRTNGTVNGTRLVRDIAPATAEGDGFASPRALTRVRGQLLFTADDGEHGRELWRSDGTESGTRMVRDVAPGAASGLFNVEALTVANGVAVFPAYGGVNPFAPWRSDGTNAGTYQLADLVLVIRPPKSASMIVLEDDAYFWAYDGTRAGIWRTDGTAAPEEISELPSGMMIIPPTVVGSAAYFGWPAEGGTGLWRVDRSGAALARVLPRSPHRFQIGGFLAVDETLVFLAADEEHGCALWRSDGSSAGTTVVADVNPHPTDCSVSTGLWTARAGDHVLFEGNDGATGTEVWALPIDALAVPSICAGDCNADARVTIDELVRGVSLALGAGSDVQCRAFDRDDDGAVSIAELIGAVATALVGC